MKVCIITNQNNIFLNLYLKYLKKISKTDLIIAIEKINYPIKDRKLENSRLTKNFRSELTSKKLPSYKKYFYKSFRSLNSNEFVQFLKKKKIPFILNTGTTEIFKKNFLFNKIINVHPAYLPKYRGCSCPEWTLYFGDRPAITAHLINKKIDLGPIIKRKFLNFKFNSYKKFRSQLYLETIKEGSKILIDIYKKKGLNKKKMIFQKKKDGNYFRPIPTKLFRTIKFVK